MLRRACLLVLVSAVYFAFPAQAARPRPLPYPTHAGFPVDADKSALPEQVARPVAAETDSVHDFDVQHYRLDLDFPCVGTNLSGTNTITLRSMVPVLTRVGLDCVSLSVTAVTQDGEPAAFTSGGGQLNVTLPVPVPMGGTTVLTVTYHGPAAAGYYQAYPETWFTFTEPSNSRCWFPCYDQPWDKATSEIHATVPDTMFVASNGVQTAPPDVNAPAHKKTYHWGTGYPVATYLMSVAIAHYVQLSDSALYVPLRSYVLKADSAKAAYDFGNLADMVNYFGSLWGQYPFENYGMAATKNFGGGMEHQTRTTITRNWITGTRSWEWGIAHELAHQWWGDMVTCLTWPNVWVNEGFASYADILYSEHAYGAANATARLQSWARDYFKEESTSSYPLYDPPSNKLFGLTIYFKGAWVLHMLRHVMGDSAFIAGWRDYGVAHKYAGGTVADFQSAMEARYGGSLAWFFDPWVRGLGYPVFRVSQNSVPRAGGGYYCYVTLEQVQTVPTRYRMPVDLVLRAGARDTLVQVWVGPVASATQFTLASPLDSVTVDPGGWLLFKSAGRGGISESGPVAGLPQGPRIARVRHGQGEVELECELPAGSPGEPRGLELFDVLGRRMATLWRGGGSSGTFGIRWAGALGEGAGAVGAVRAPSGPAASGIYFARLSAGGRSATAKVLWLR